jgi:hypothetical protein
MLKKMQVFYEALEIDPFKLHPSMKIKAKLNQIND